MLLIYSLFSVRGRHDEAEAMFRRAIAADKDGAHPKAIAAYASFAYKVRRDTRLAHRLYQRATSHAPFDAGAFLFSLSPRTYIESIMTELCTYFTSIIIELLLLFHIFIFNFFRYLLVVCKFYCQRIE